jgi:outer membrane protein OmpA-like peptidoglycan-associated protein
MTLVACSVPEIELNCAFKEPSNEIAAVNEVAIVLAPSDKFVDFDSALSAARSPLEELMTDKPTSVAVVLADGNPRVIAKFNVDTTGTLTGSGKELKISDGLATLNRVVKCVEANDQDLFAVSAETDFLGAIQKGGATFSNDATEKHLFVIGNGLQTSGAFSFTSGLNVDQTANDATVADLVSKNSIGNLGGATVTWIGLGQTRQGDQKSLDENANSILTDFWTKVVSAAGGKPSGIVAGSVSQGTSTTGGIPTSIVPFAAVETCIEPITVTSDQGFEFNDDVATFKDRGKAKASAEKIKVQLDEAECLNGLTVTGYVASGGSPEGCARAPGFALDLSLQRATAFMELLKEVGVTKQITPEAGGLGPVNDCVNGVGDEELMKQNRIAKITARQ